MNDPHTAHTALDQQDAQDDFEVTPDFLAFARKAFKVWQSGDTDAEKGSEIRRLALLALAEKSNEGDEDNGETIRQHRIPNTQGSWCWLRPSYGWSTGKRCGRAHGRQYIRPPYRGRCPRSGREPAHGASAHVTPEQLLNERKPNRVRHHRLQRGGPCPSGCR